MGRRRNVSGTHSTEGGSGLEVAHYVPVVDDANSEAEVWGGFAVATCQWLTAVSSKVDVARASADRWRDAQTRVTSPPRTLEECRDCPRPGHQQRSLPLTVDHCILDIYFIRYSVCCDPSPDCKRLRTMHIVARRSTFSSTSRLNSHTRPFSKSVWIRHRVNAHHTRQRDRPLARTQERMNCCSFTSTRQPKRTTDHPRPLSQFLLPRVSTTHEGDQATKTRYPRCRASETNPECSCPPATPWTLSVSHTDGARKWKAKPVRLLFIFIALRALQPWFVC